jgi:hypothetical protein
MNKQNRRIEMKKLQNVNETAIVVKEGLYNDKLI